MNGSAVNPMALSVEEISRLLRASGAPEASAEVIRGYIERGAPVDGDGRVNLVHFTAWLLKENISGA